MTSFCIWGCIEAEAWAKGFDYETYVILCERVGFIAQTESMYWGITRLLDVEMEAAMEGVSEEDKEEIMDIFMEEY